MEIVRARGKKTELRRLASREGEDSVFPLVWYAVMWSKELVQHPIKRTVAGLDLILFRDQSGIVRCVDACCPHRGADLSLGRIEGGTLRCAYHGWAFDGEGHCERIPAHPARSIPEFANLLSYPIQEIAGLVWVYPQANGDVQPSSLEVFPELTDVRYVLAPYDAKWQAHFTRTVESVLDVAHLAFVHRKTIGKRLNPEIRSLDFEVKGRDRIQIKNGGGILDYIFPQQWLLRPDQGGKQGFINYVTFTPVNSHKTMIFGYAGRTFLRRVPFVTSMFSHYSLKILEEDRKVVESQRPRPIPKSMQMEAHVPADGPQVRFRQRWYQFLLSDEEKIVLRSRS